MKRVTPSALALLLASSAAWGQSAVGPAGAVQYSNGSGTFQADSDIVVANHQIVTLGPLLDVRNPLFATGSGVSGHAGANCVGVAGNTTGLADPTGTYDSTCAIQNAAIYAEYTLIGGLNPTLYFPHGKYVVGTGNTGLTGILEFNGFSVSMVGDDLLSSQIVDMATHATLFTTINTYGVSVRNLTLAGHGPQGATTGGGLIEAFNSQSLSINHVSFQTNAGIAMNLQGSSERYRIFDTIAGGNLKIFNSEGNTNEGYIDNGDWSFNGRVNSWLFNSNTNPYTGVEQTVACDGTASAYAATTTYGQSTEFHPGNSAVTVSYNGVNYNSIVANNTGNTPQFQSAYWQTCGQGFKPESRELVTLDGDNVHIRNVSIKGTDSFGVKLARTNSSGTHLYCEANTQTNTVLNGCATAGNALQEISHVTGAVAASSLTVPVDDAVYQTLYVNNPAYATGAYTASDNSYALFPIDYQYGSTTPSAYWTGMLQGQYELISLNAFSGDGAAHLAARAVNGTTAPGSGSGHTAGPVNAAIAIPAPVVTNGISVSNAVLERLPKATGNAAVLEDFAH